MHTARANHSVQEVKEGEMELDMDHFLLAQGAHAVEIQNHLTMLELGMDITKIKMFWYDTLSTDDILKHQQNEQKGISMILNSLSSEFADKIARTCKAEGDLAPKSGDWLWKTLTKMLESSDLDVKFEILVQAVNARMEKGSDPAVFLETMSLL